MSISSMQNFLNSTVSPDSKKDMKAKADLGRDQFLNLLVAQLKHQDPLNPMEGADFTAQLATFSSLEQQFKTNDSLDDIRNALKTGQDSDPLGYIGKSVKTDDDSFSLVAGQPSAVEYKLDRKADVSVSIFDAQKRLVRTLYFKDKGAGSHTLDWDGRNQRGGAVPNGTYTFEIKAEDEKGVSVPWRATTKGVVTGVTYEKGEPYLLVGDRRVAPQAVVEVKPVESNQALSNTENK